ERVEIGLGQAHGGILSGWQAILQSPVARMKTRSAVIRLQGLAASEQKAQSSRHKRKRREEGMRGLAPTAGLLALCALAFAAAPAAADSQQEANKKTVLAFYEAAINQKDFAAASRYLGPRYTQHNPLAADGPEGLKAFIAFLKEKFPNAKSDIKRVFA